MNALAIGPYDGLVKDKKVHELAVEVAPGQGAVRELRVEHLDWAAAAIDDAIEQVAVYDKLSHGAMIAG